MSKKEYKKGNLTVVWKKDICVHAANCVKGLPDVFDSKARPWINMDGADAEAIKKQVDQCPSGALSYIIHEEPVAGVMEAKEFIEVETMKDGPLIVHSKVNVKHGNVTITKEGEKTAFCRCGASENKPFCDGTHRKIDFKD